MTNPNPPLITEPVTVETLNHAAQMMAPLTVLSYGHQWRVFVHWCKERSVVSLPAKSETIIEYLMHVLNRGCKVSTAVRYLNSVRYHHAIAGYPWPCEAEIQRLLLGARRVIGTPLDQKAPLRIEHLRMLCIEPATSTVDLRNRAVVLFGFASALRRSNIVALDLGDLEMTREGIRVTIRREKQDQQGRGRVIGIPRGSDRATCPVKAVEAWLVIRGHQPGPLFNRMHWGRVTSRRLHPNRIGSIVKDAVERLGFDARLYAGHSLRAGFATESIPKVGEILTARHTGHRSLSALRRYLRLDDPFHANACAALDL